MTRTTQLPLTGLISRSVVKKVTRNTEDPSQLLHQPIMLLSSDRPHRTPLAQENIYKKNHPSPSKSCSKQHKVGCTFMLSIFTCCGQMCLEVCIHLYLKKNLSKTNFCFYGGTHLSNYIYQVLYHLPLSLSSISSLSPSPSSSMFLCLSSLFQKTYQKSPKHTG